MSIREVIAVITQMEADGAVDRYAIVEQGTLDTARFQEIVRRHDLVDAWTTFERQFLTDTP